MLPQVHPQKLAMWISWSLAGSFLLYRELLLRFATNLRLRHSRCRQRALTSGQLHMSG